MTPPPTPPPSPHHSSLSSSVPQTKMNACFTSGQALFDASVPTSADQVDFCTTQACPDLLTALVRAAVADTSGTDYTKCSAIGGMGGFSNSICTKDGSGALCPFVGWMTTMTNIPAFKMFDAMNPSSSISQACVNVSFQRKRVAREIETSPAALTLTTSRSRPLSLSHCLCWFLPNPPSCSLAAMRRESAPSAR